MDKSTGSRPVGALCLFVGFVVLAAWVGIGKSYGLTGSTWFLLALFAVETVALALVVSVVKGLAK